MSTADELIAAVKAGRGRARRGDRRRGTGARFGARRRRRIGAHAVAVSIEPGGHRRAARGRPRSRRLRGRGARLPRSAARTARRRSAAVSARSRPTATPRSISRPSSPSRRRPGPCSMRARRSTWWPRTRCGSSPSTARPPGRQSRSAGCCSRPERTVDARQAGGFTPLHEAAQNGDPEMVELFLSAGADPAATHGRRRRPPRTSPTRLPTRTWPGASARSPR